VMRSDFWVHPLARNVDIDSPATTGLRRKIIAQKAFLRKIYEEWYKLILSEVPAGPGSLLEVGTGAGFLSRYAPGLIRSDVFALPGLDVVLDSRHLPFACGCLRAIAMTDVFHHISSPSVFLHEAARCVRPGGAIVMIEPWDSRWSRWVYRNLHHEPYRHDAEHWDFPSTGPLSGANGALPWIVFERDRARFTEHHPQWRVTCLRRLMPLAYLASGGVTYRSLMPGWSFPLFRALERLLPARQFAMFAFIKLERTDASPIHQSQSSAITLSS
jgi:SAM-dependent methyltransferase